MPGRSEGTCEEAEKGFVCLCCFRSLRTVKNFEKHYSIVWKKKPGKFKKSVTVPKMGVRRALRARRTPIFGIFLEFSGWFFFRTILYVDSPTLSSTSNLQKSRHLQKVASQPGHKTKNVQTIATLLLLILILLPCKSRVICKKNRVAERHNRVTQRKICKHVHTVATLLPLILILMTCRIRGFVSFGKKSRRGAAQSGHTANNVQTKLLYCCLLS